MATNKGWWRSLTKLQRIGLVYACLFFIVVGIGYIPGAKGENDLLFGLYHIDFIDDVLHGASGIWAAYAAMTSFSAARFYFRTFGTIYFLDGLLGLVTGFNYLNLHIFMADLHPAIEGMRRIGVNAPHVVIGLSAMYLGFVLHKQLSKK